MFILSEQKSSVAHLYISQLRDVTQQNSRALFRRNLQRLGEILGYELSKHLTYHTHAIQTPLELAEGYQLADKLVIATVLRAGLPLYQGLLNIFEEAESAFIGAYRREDTAELSVAMDYVATPPLDGKVLIIADPMLATGKSLVESIQRLANSGTPRHIHIVSAIASRPGIAYVQQNLANISLWLGAVDEILNQKAYIVPGLGDAGDLSFGEKL